MTEPQALRVRKLLDRRANVSINNGAVETWWGDSDQGEIRLTISIVSACKEVTVINLNKLGSLKEVLRTCQERCDYLILFGDNESNTSIFVEFEKTVQNNREYSEFRSTT